MKPITRNIVSPLKYVQGKGVYANMHNYTKDLGKKIFVLFDMNVTFVKDVLKKAYEGTDCVLTFEQFKGECSMKEIDRNTDICKKAGCEVVLAFGGGKTIDTGKAVGFFCKIPSIICATTAATDAPTSSSGVIYTEEGQFEKYMYFGKNPYMVLIDTEVVANAPVRFLVSGMGDALSTYFEARACHRANANTNAGGKVSITAMALAELCYRTLLKEGLKAKIACEKKLCTKAVEDIIETNTYLSGIGFESGGLAAAHAIHNGLTAIKECHKMYHGEKVSFGTLSQLVLENAPLDEIKEVCAFCNSIGLPTTLEDLGIKTIKLDEIKKVSELTCVDGESVHNMPFKVTPSDVYNAILAADAIGHKYKNL